MSASRPFRFSAVLDHARPQQSHGVTYAEDQYFSERGGEQPWSREAWVAKARRVEALGYTSFLVADHPWTDIAPLPALMTVAETTALRIGSHVLNVDLRNPSLLAKDLAMLDVLSDGRFECGLGCGVIAEDYVQVGRPFDQPGVRLSRFAEALQIIKRFFSEETVTFSGQYYQITGLPAHPKPVQKPHPPIYLGGGGKRVLSLAAKEADIVGFVARSKPTGLDWLSATHEANLEKLAWVREAAGARFDQLELATTIFAVVPTDNRQETAQHMAGQFGITPEQLLSCTHVLIGTVDEMVEELLKRREHYHMSAIAVAEAGIEPFAQVLARLRGQ